jgi:hypothetical protein
MRGISVWFGGERKVYADGDASWAVSIDRSGLCEVVGVVCAARAATGDGVYLCAH